MYLWNSFADSFLVLDLKRSQYLTGQVVSVGSHVAPNSAGNMTTLLQFSAVIALASGTQKNTSSLLIYQYFGKFKKSLIGSITPTTERKWKNYTITLPPSEDNFGILFEAIIGAGGDDDMIIDDIILKSGVNNRTAHSKFFKNHFIYKVTQ